MSNMSYCRFQNTLADLRDCYNNIHDDLDGSEFQSRAKLIELCKQIAEFDADDFEESPMCEGCGLIEGCHATDCPYDKENDND